MTLLPQTYGQKLGKAGKFSKFRPDSRINFLQIYINIIKKKLGGLDPTNPHKNVFLFSFIVTILLNFYDFWHESCVSQGKQNLFFRFWIFALVSQILGNFW